MEFKLNSKVLEKLLTKIIPAIPSRTPMPVLENFLMDLKDGQLTIYATDLEISLKSSLNVVSEENIKIVVPARLLYDIVKSLQETTIYFDVTPNGKLNLKTDTGLYTISYLLPEEFPDIPEFPQNNNDNKLGEIEIAGAELKEAIELTSFAMSKEDMRPAMMGTLFEFTDEGLRMVTTDGHRLANLLKKSIKPGFVEQYIVPERAVSVLLKILEDKDVKMLLSKTHISFKVGDIEFITRLIGQKYPDYNSVIPMENENVLKVHLSELLSTVKRMLLFSPTNSRKVKFAITKDNIEISAEDIDLGSFAKENVICEYKGEPMEIGFNSLYVNDIISHMPGEVILFKLNSPTKAVIVVPEKNEEQEELTMLLMPVRLNN